MALAQQPTRWSRKIANLALAIVLVLGFAGLMAWVAGVSSRGIGAFLGVALLLILPPWIIGARKRVAGEPLPPPEEALDSSAARAVIFWVLGIGVVLPTLTFALSATARLLLAPLIGLALWRLIDASSTQMVLQWVFAAMSLVGSLGLLLYAWRRFSMPQEKDAAWR